MKNNGQKKLFGVVLVFIFSVIGIVFLQYWADSELNKALEGSQIPTVSTASVSVEVEEKSIKLDDIKPEILVRGMVQTIPKEKKIKPANTKKELESMQKDENISNNKVLIN